MLLGTLVYINVLYTFKSKKNQLYSFLIMNNTVLIVAQLQPNVCTLLGYVKEELWTLRRKKLK